MGKQKKPILQRLHDHFLPHKRNDYKPHVFRTASVAVIVFCVLVLQAAYLAQIKFVIPNTDFLGAVLPAALISLTNDDRAANDLTSLTQDALLTKAAQYAANDMAAKGYFAHVSPDGKDPWYWLNLVGYQYQYAGQNLAVNFTDSTAVEQAWMASPSHHANIVKPQYTKIGIGVANGMYEGKETTFVVQFFAAPAAGFSETTNVAVAAGTPKVLSAKSAAPTAPAARVAPKTVAIAPAPTVTAAAHADSPLPAPTIQVPRAVNSMSPLSRFFSQLVTSPTLTMTTILSILTSIILMLLAITVVAMTRAERLELMAGSLVLPLVTIGLIFFNIQNAPKVQLSPDSQAAAVVASFP